VPGSLAYNQHLATSDDSRPLRLCENQATLGMAGAIIGEAALSFLGLGVQPPTPSWGTMLNGGRAHLLDAPHLTIFPALAIALLVLGFYFLGDGLRDATDPKS
jgi:peptide/nickel transport system permease protein